MTESNEAGAIDLCQAGLHQLLANIGEQNIVKLQRSVPKPSFYTNLTHTRRKLMTCHINAGNFRAANDVLAQQSELARKHPLSNYLSYVIALRTQDAIAGTHHSYAARMGCADSCS